MEVNFTHLIKMILNNNLHNIFYCSYANYGKVKKFLKFYLLLRCSYDLKTIVYVKEKLVVMK